MNKNVKNPIYELIYVIVNYGMGSKVLQKAKEFGIPGGTVFLGKGTVNNAILDFLSLNDERKEIVLLGTDIETANYALDMLNKKFMFEKPHHGIVFTTSICGAIGSKCLHCDEVQEERGVSEIMYQYILAIVNKGKAEEVIDAATKAGSKGGTIVNARGSGVHETSRLFHMDIEPEREMVMIISKEEVTDKIVDSIRENLDIDKPGNGIIFVQDVNRTYGIYE